MIKGKTTFGELTGWGVSQERIEQIIGAPIREPAVSVKDYANTQGFDFETLKATLQTEADKVKPWSVRINKMPPQLISRRHSWWAKREKTA